MKYLLLIITIILIYPLKSYSQKSLESNTDTLLQPSISIYNYDGVIIGKDTFSIDQYIYLSNSGYFTWSKTPYFKGTSNLLPFNNSYDRKSIYRNGILNFLYIKL